MAVFPLLHAAPRSAPQHGGLLLYIHFFLKNLTWETNKMHYAGRKRCKTLKSSLRYAHDCQNMDRKVTFPTNGWTKKEKEKKRVCGSSAAENSWNSVWTHAEKALPRASHCDVIKRCHKRTTTVQKKRSRMNDVWQMWARLSWSCLTFGKHWAIHAASWAQVGRRSLSTGNCASSACAP